METAKKPREIVTGADLFRLFNAGVSAQLGGWTGIEMYVAHARTGTVLRMCQLPGTARYEVRVAGYAFPFVIGCDSQVSVHHCKVIARAGRNDG